MKRKNYIVYKNKITSYGWMFLKWGNKYDKYNKKKENEVYDKKNSNN